MKKAKIVSLLTAGILMLGSQAFGLTLLSENFDSIAFLPNRSAMNLYEISGQLPAGTTWAAPTTRSVNVRYASDSINTYVPSNPNTIYPPSFNSFFSPADTSNKFLVLGDEAGIIGAQPDYGTSSVSIPFYAIANDLDIHVDAAVNGWNLSGENEFSIYLSDSKGHTATLFEGYSFGQANFDFDVNIFDIGLRDRNLTITFELDEYDPLGTKVKNAAAGIDNLSIEATVPEPSTFFLLGAGLGGLALLRRKARS